MTSKISPRIFVLGEIEEENVNDLIYFILKINEEDSKKSNPLPIKLIINSIGGDVYSCFGLIDIIEQSITPIHGYVYGQAMSAAFPIFISCHERSMSKNSTLMYHDMHWSLHASSTTHIKESIEGKRMMGIFDKIITSKTKLTQNQLDKIKKENRDQYYTSQQSLKLGITDSII